VKFTSDKSSIS